MQGSLYKYPRLIILFLLLVFAAGAGAIVSMPRLEDPELVNRNATILTRYPGATAERVEALISEPIENKLREVDQIDEINSTSRPGISVVTIELKDAVTDSEPVMAELRDKLGELNSLPEGATVPFFDTNRSEAFTVLVALLWDADVPPDYAILGRYATEIETRIANMAGTEHVRIFGLPEEEISVTVKANKLASLGLTINDIASRVFGGDAKSSAGRISGRDTELVVEVSGSFDAVQRIRRIPLAVDDGRGVVFVGDIADIRRGYAEPPGTLTRISGQDGIVIAARSTSDVRIDLWTRDVQAFLAEFELLLPDRITAELIFNQTTYTEDRLSNLLWNLIMGALIVVTVLLVTLGWRASVIAASILPLASLAALAILSSAGFEIERMVVTGMIVALGIMVDNAIVVTDGVQARLLDGDRRSQAVSKTVKKLWIPLLGSTITTMIAFMPIILMPGNAGEFVGGLSAAVIASLAASYVIAFTIIAALAGRVLVRRSRKPSTRGPDRPERLWWRAGIEGRFVADRFRQTLGWSMDHPRLSMALAFALPLLGFVLANSLTEQFFPPSDRDQFIIEMQLPAQASIDETQRLVKRVDAVLEREPAITSSVWYIGSSAAKFYNNLIGNKDGVASYAEAMVTARSYDDARRIVDDLQPLLDRRFPEAQIIVRGLEQGPPFEAPLEVRVIGPELDQLRQSGEEIQRAMLEMAAVTHARTRLSMGRPKLAVQTNETEAAALGLTLRSLTDQIRVALDGAISGSLLEETTDIPVRVRLDRNARTTVDGLRNLQIAAPNPVRGEDGGAHSVPLSAIADVRLEPAIAAIPRRNGERNNTIQGFLKTGVLPEIAFQELRQKLEAAGVEGRLPPGYRIEFGGESEKRNEAIGKLLAEAGVLGVLMILAIVLTFNSFRLGGITLASAVQAAGLGLFSLWVFQFPLGFVVIVGLMGLIGLAINAAIVILSELKGDPSASEGDKQAIIAGVLSTGRHISSTTLTTMGGFLPLILSGDAIWTPFAIAIAGGAVLSMIVSFYFVPAAFKIAVDRRPLSDGRQSEPESLTTIRTGHRQAAE